MDVRLPDGTIIQNVPEGTTKADLTAKLQRNGMAVPAEWLQAQPAPTEQPVAERPGGIASTAAGLGAGLGNVAMGAQHYLGKGVQAVGGMFQSAPTLSSLITGPQQNPIQRAGQWLVNDAAQGRQNIAAEMAPYKAAHPYLAGGGELAGEVAATLPVGGALAAPLKALSLKVPALAAYLTPAANALQSAGFSTGVKAAPGVAGAATNALTRAAGGAVNGGVSAGLVDPQSAGIGAGLGAVLPGAAKIGAAGGELLSDATSAGAKKLMQSALKPTIAQLRTGDAATAVETLLKYGINPTKAGVAKLQDLIDGLNTQIGNAVSSSTARVSKADAMRPLGDVRTKFSNQVSPSGDLNAIQSVANDFMAHPGLIGPDMSVQAAQAMKQGTYSVLKGKYGAMGSAETEAQKALARGLKDEVASAVPGISGLNAEESKLLSTLKVTERRALMDLNKNPMGLAALANNPLNFAMFMADRSVAFKSLLARMVNASAPAANALGSSAQLALEKNPLLRTAAVVGGSNP